MSDKTRPSKGTDCGHVPEVNVRNIAKGSFNFGVMYTQFAFVYLPVMIVSFLAGALAGPFKIKNKDHQP